MTRKMSPWAVEQVRHEAFLEAKTTKLKLSYLAHTVRRQGSLGKASVLGKTKWQATRKSKCELDGVRTGSHGLREQSKTTKNGTTVDVTHAQGRQELETTQRHITHDRVRVIIFLERSFRSPKAKTS